MQNAKRRLGRGALRGLGWLGAALLVLVPMSGRAAESKAAPTASPSAPALEPKAIEILRGMSARLAAAKSMRFTAITSYESPSRFGPPLVYSTLSRVAMRRPDRLAITSPGDGPPFEFFYDGKEITAYAPSEKLIATAEAPSTIDGALRQAYEDADIYFPFTDVLVKDPYAAIADGLKVAFYVGRSTVVGGTTTDIVVAANDRVFAQLWIGAEDRLPRRSRAVYLSDPARLRNEVDFSDWRLDQAIPDDAFAPSGAEGARPVSFARPDPQLPEGAFPSPESEGLRRKE